MRTTNTTRARLVVSVGEMISEAGSDTDIILTIVYGIGDAGVDPVEFSERQAESTIQPCRHATTSQYAKRLPVDRELEVDVFLCTAEQGLSIGNKAA